MTTKYEGGSRENPEQGERPQERPKQPIKTPGAKEKGLKATLIGTLLDGITTRQGVPGVRVNVGEGLPVAAAEERAALTA